MTPPLSDAIVTALAQLVDDAQTGRREPSHSDLEFQIERAHLVAYDPKGKGQTLGKAKRIRFVLSSAMEHDPNAGGRLVGLLLELVRGHGGFRPSSSNYVTAEAIENAVAAFATEGYDLSLDGGLQPQVLTNLSGLERSSALRAYARRAQRGVKDAALVSGTGKDLLEATAAHILRDRYRTYPRQANFPTLLGQAFSVLGMATPEGTVVQGESPMCAIERSMFQLACDVNKLRNKEGTGHGRPWLPNVSVTEAKAATEFMGVIAEYMLARHDESNR